MIYHAKQHGRSVILKISKETTSNAFAEFHFLQKLADTGSKEHFTDASLSNISETLEVSASPLEYFEEPEFHGIALGFLGMSALRFCTSPHSFSEGSTLMDVINNEAIDIRRFLEIAVYSTLDVHLITEVKIADWNR